MCASSWFYLQDYTRMHGQQNIKEEEWDGREMWCIQGFGGDTWGGGEYHYEAIGRDWRIILEWILKTGKIDRS